MILAEPIGLVEQTDEWIGSSLFNATTNGEVPQIVLSQTVHYAIEIDVSDNTDIPDEKEIGLFQDSAIGGSLFRWTTERPNYDGSTVIPTGDRITATSLKWGEGMITSRKQLGTPNRLINVNVAGNYGSLSGFNFSIDNIVVESGNFAGQQFFDILDDNAIYLLNRKVRFFIIINNVFYNVWSGVVSKQSHDEKKFSVICEDDFKNIHKVIPPKIANENLFKDILKKSIGKSIPVTFGNVNHGKAVNIQSKKEPIVLTSDTIGAFVVDSTVAVVTDAQNITVDNNFTNTLVRVLTGQKTYHQNSLVGKYFRFVNDGGTDNFYLISGQTESEIDPVSGLQNFLLATYSFIDLAGLIFYDPSESSLVDGEKKTWVEVFDFESIYISSNRPISDFPNSPTGPNATIQYFDSNNQEFIDVSETLEVENETSISNIGFPGFIGFTESLANNGIFRKITLLKPKKVVASGHGKGNGATVLLLDYESNGEELPRLTDGDRNTKYELKVKNAEGELISNFLSFNLQLPDELNEGDFDSFFVMLDYDVEHETASDANRDLIQYNVIPSGVHRGVGGYRNDIAFQDGQFAADVPFLVRMIPPSQYLEEGQPPPLLGAALDHINMQEFYQSRHALKAYPFLHVIVLLSNNATIPAGGSNSDLKIYQAAIGGEKQLRISDNTVFIKMLGETSSVGGDITNNVFHTFESILVDYDGINSAADLDMTDIDSRKQWNLGRQLTERKSSFTYLKELAMQSFCGLFPSRDGKRKLKAFRDFQDAQIVFSNDNGNIIENSITKFELSPINEVYNEFDIKYEYIESANRFDKSIFIKKVDEPALPGPYVSTNPGADNTYTSFTSFGVTSGSDLNGRATGAFLWTTPPVDVVIGASFSYDGLGPISFGVITGKDASAIYVEFDNPGGLIQLETSTVGNFYLQGTSIPAWTEFIGGFDSYSRAMELWTVCRNSYLRTLVVR